MARPAVVKQASEDQQLEWYRSKVAAAMDLLDKSKALALRDQNYYDGVQWTQQEIDTLKGRNQPALTFNHIKPAINALIGVVERGKTDPKGWGRTPKDQNAAEVATDGLRYVSDTTRFNHKRLQALKDFLIWGVCGGVVEIDQDSGQEIGFTRFRAEEYFYDPYSRELDFSDARFDGLAKWMDEADAIALYPDKEKEIRNAVDIGNSVISNSYEDRPKEAWSWADSKTRRVMVFEMYHRKGRDWYKCVFVGGAILENGPSPYKDSQGRPKKCTIAQSAYVDSDNCRYGVIRDMIGPQDAINKARSKAVHILNTRQVRVRPGVKDVDEVRREAAKADGVFEYNKDDFEILETHTQFLPAHLELLRDAKAEMSRQSPTPGLVGRNDASQSGRAILAEQQAGLAEQAPILAGFDDWTLRVYRSFWEAIKQFWTAPKWVRVTDDEDAPKFILMNAPEGQPEMDPKTGQPMVDPQTGQPKMMQPNRPAEMDVDIIIDSSPDTAALQEEQFTKLAELKQADPASIPMDVLIEASSLPRKRLLLDKMKQAQEQQQGQPNPAAIEQAKAQVQLQAKQQMAQIDAQAHAEQLQRDDQADQRKAERSAALEDQKFQNDMRRLQMQDEAANLNAQRSLEMDTIKRTSEFEHATKSKQMDLDFEGKKRTAKGSQASNDNEDDDMKIELDPKLQEMIAQSVIAKNMANGPDAIAKAMTQIEAATAAIQNFTQVVASPKRLVKDPKTGEKRVEMVS